MRNQRPKQDSDILYIKKVGYSLRAPRRKHPKPRADTAYMSGWDTAKVVIIFEITTPMDIKEFSAQLKAKKKEIQTLIHKRAPVIVGKMAKDHFQGNFRKGGFVNDGIHPWPQSRRLSSGDSGYGTLLSSRKHLYKSIKYVPSDARVRVSNDLIYAPIHNWGGEITVTPRMKRFAWAKYYKATGQTRKPTKGKKKGKRGQATPIKESEEAKFWKRMALTKKRKIKIPQRQFLGQSKELTQAIHERLDKDIRNIINS